MSAAEPKAATRVRTGRPAILWFLASEIVIFGGLIVTYALFHLRHPEWYEDAQHTITAAGGIATIVLLTSSLTMVLAHAAASRGMLERAGRYLSLTATMGGIFVVVKTFEYSQAIAGGFTPAKSLFWSFYYAMTGLHALHVVGGIVAINVIGAMLRAGKNVHRVEFVGIYWHFVAIVWILLFPLLYLTT